MKAISMPEQNITEQYLEFARCKHVTWRIRTLSYPEFMSVVESIEKFIQGLAANEEKELIVSVKNFLGETIPQLAKIIVQPIAPTLFGKIKNWIFIRTEKIDVTDPIQYADVNDIAKLYDAFFFLNSQWMTNLNDSAVRLGTTVTQSLTAAIAMMTQSIGVKSSTSSPTEEKPN